MLIASTMWLVNALGKRYETTVSIPVEYINLPKDKVLVKAPPSSLHVKMEAIGFTLLRHKISLTIDPLTFNVKAFTNNLMSSSKAENYSIATDKYLPQFSRQIKSEIQLIDISPDTLYFQFERIVSSKKAIKSNFEMSFENQFFLYDSITFEPDSIVVKGPRSIVESTDYILTKSHKFEDLNSSVKRNISLNLVDNLQFDVRRVVVNIPVSQYTEYSNKISISKFNVPDSLKLITLPGKVNVNCLVALNEYKNISASSFIIGVDYRDIKEDTNEIPIKIYRSPAHIKRLNHFPNTVKFIIEKKYND